MSILLSPDIRTRADGSTQILSLDPNGQVHLYDLFPGVKLMFIHIRSPRWPNEGWGQMDDKVTDHTFILNYSSAGSCKIGSGNDHYFIQNQGDISLSSLFAKEDFLYPEGMYDGLEYFIVPELLAEDHPFRALLGADPGAVFERYSLRRKTRIGIAEGVVLDALQTIWELYDDGLSEEGLAEARLQTLRLFRALQYGEDPFRDQRRAMFTGGQMRIAEQVEALITENLKRTWTLAELSEQFGVSETSLKMYFKSVYGRTIASYLRQKRMRKAAELLLDSTQKRSVLDVALDVGYENQSKFAAAFKNEYGVPPLEYKRNQKEPRS